MFDLLFLDETTNKNNFGVRFKGNKTNIVFPIKCKSTYAYTHSDTHTHKTTQENFFISVHILAQDSTETRQNGP